MIALQQTPDTQTPATLTPQPLQEATTKGGGLSFALLLDQTLVSDSENNIEGLDDTLATKSDVQDILEINPDVKESLGSLTDFKQLIHDAKVYLKNKIVNSDGYKQAAIEKLPKTLKGLVGIANKLGIDISKITLEEVQQAGSGTTKPQTEKNFSLQEQKSFNDRPKKELPATQSIETKPLKESKTTQQKEKTSDVLFEKTQQSGQKKATPLFQTQPQNRVDISTQQLINTKTLNSSQNRSSLPKIKKESKGALASLLQKKEPLQKSNPLLTSDLSLTTAKVVAPALHQKESIDSLASLLQKKDENKEDMPSKAEGVHIAKADSFEVKLNEAKQMVKYLSHDVKEAIDNYKAPFTKVKIQLNPQKLGEVDVTIIQRGKNLHVNLSSNNAAINTLALNANDLKVQLQNSGIQNASLNFNNNAQSGGFANGGESQQQQQHHRQQAQSEYNYFENEEKKEELTSSLEIIVPNYA